MQRFTDVQVLKFTEEEGGLLGCSKQTDRGVTAIIDTQQCSLILTQTEKGSGKERDLQEMPLAVLSCSQLTERSLALRATTVDFNASSLILQFPSPTDASSFRRSLSDSQRLGKRGGSIFDQRTEESSAVQYFQFYGYLSQQQNMLQDYVRTATYQRAILSNLGDFKDKVVLDVGAGSGILSFFAVQAGAKRVYAVEASSMAQHCEALIRANGYGDKILVIGGKVEEVSIPEKVDLIISEPMGYMLLNERMLESFLHAKKFLRPQGRMYPSRGDLHMAPFTDEALYLEQNSKAAFWCQDSFHGVNLSHLRPQALKEYLRQPIVDTWHIGILMARSHCWSVDFGKAGEEDLHNIEIPFKFILQSTGHIHGLAFWFDVAFVGCTQTVWLSTSPTEPLTHWYQVRCLLDTPILGKTGQPCTGKVVLKANTRQSYDVDIEVVVDGKRGTNTLDLKNPYFRYTGQAVVAPPGQQTGTTSPTEAYWNTNIVQQPQPATGGSNGVYSQMVNGGGAYSTLMQPEGAGGLYHSTTGTSPLPHHNVGLMDLSLLGNQQQAVFSGRPVMGSAPDPTPLVTSLPLKMNSTNQQSSEQSLPFSSPSYPGHMLQQAGGSGRGAVGVGGGGRGQVGAGDGHGILLSSHTNPWTPHH